MLGVRSQTLYAYVSRKLVRVCADPADARRSLYARSDVDALAKRSRRSRARATVAAEAIRWGDPVLLTAISHVRSGELFFGTMNARDCAAAMSLEDVAAHHCQVPVFGSAARPATPLYGSTPIERAFHYLAAQTESHDSMRLRDRQSLAEDGAALLSGVVGSMLGEQSGGPVHERLRHAWNLSAISADMVRRALVLLSDHELNPSTFAVRVCASTGSSLPASLLAGLATLTGSLHGGVWRMAGEALRAASTSRAALERFLAQTAHLSPYGFGFGHPLYPDGDPRAACLLESLESGDPLRLAVARVVERVEAQPNVDIALAVLAARRQWPEHAPFLIFAAGRLTGWIAHAIEQSEQDQIIRPRARYTPTAVRAQNPL